MTHPYPHQQYQPPQPPRQGMSRKSKISLIVAGAVVALGGIISVVDPDAGTTQAGADTSTKVPAYTVLKDSGQSAELLVKDATKASATAAISDWLSGNTDNRKIISVQVVRSKDAATIVCRGEYLADEDAAELYTGGRVKAASWPHTEIDCPDPGGS